MRCLKRWNFPPVIMSWETCLCSRVRNPDATIDKKNNDYFAPVCPGMNSGLNICVCLNWGGECIGYFFIQGFAGLSLPELLSAPVSLQMSLYLFPLILTEQLQEKKPQSPKGPTFYGKSYISFTLNSCRDSVQHASPNQCGASRCRGTEHLLSVRWGGVYVSVRWEGRYQVLLF